MSGSKDNASISTADLSTTDIIQTDKDVYINCIQIGSGTYGTVYRALSKNTGRSVAIKRLAFKVRTAENGETIVPKFIVREVQLLQQMQHTNIIKLSEYNIKNRTFYLIFELMYTDLKKYILSIPKEKKMEKTLMKSFLYQIINGLAFCHSLNIMHRDLKPANLLIAKDGTLKIGDFGLSRQVAKLDDDTISLTPLVVTLWYRAPELLLGVKTYSTSIDIWSLGCTFAEMATKEVLFSGSSEIEQLKHIFNILKAPTEETWPGVTNLHSYKAAHFTQNIYRLHTVMGDTLNTDEITMLEDMLIYNPTMRATAANLIKNKYFDDVDINTVPEFYRTDC